MGCPKLSNWFFISERLWVFCLSFSHSTHRPLKPILRVKAVKMEQASWDYSFLSSVDSFAESTCFYSISSAFRQVLFVGGEYFCVFLFVCFINNSGRRQCVLAILEANASWPNALPLITWVSIFQVLISVSCQHLSTELIMSHILDYSYGSISLNGTHFYIKITPDSER